jgi:tRNA threonylcarbamoyladenosine biosynthesis protein TsaE
MDSPITYHAEDLAATDRLGKALAAALPDGTTVALSGTLGAGKTRLVTAVASACGIPPEQVTSPTFVLVHEYFGDRTIYHFDAYRLKDEDEFLELGPEEYFEGDGISLIEWAEKVTDCLPLERLEILIETVGPRSRRFHITAKGKGLEEVLADLPRRLRC